MPDAFVRYRSGGGYQQVAGYDYVFDSRKFLENGYYRDSGFMPVAVTPESTAIDADEFQTLSFGSGALSQYANGTVAGVSGIASTITGVSIKQPDEVSHTAPRQLSYYDTTLTFCADSDVSATFTASDSSSRTLLTVADTSIFGGKNVILTGADLPSATFAGQVYIAVPISATTMLLQTSVGSAYVAWGDAGSGTLTVSVVSKIAEFPWRDILGWSNTAPTR
jgi:hypothetical protein